jgi:hypothetical protein
MSLPNREGIGRVISGMGSVKGVEKALLVNIASMLRVVT